MDHRLNAPAGRLDLLSHIVRFRLAGLRRSRSFIPVIVLLIAAVFFTWDIYTDIVINNEGVSEVLVEGIIYIAVLLVLAIEVKRVVDMYSTVRLSQTEILRLKSHLTQVISDEFERWQLTPGEKEIALLLIKGLSMQEIADIRNVKAKSVRQQSTAIYTKGGVANRYELSAYFIEDLLMPMDSQAETPDGR